MKARARTYALILSGFSLGCDGQLGGLGDGTNGGSSVGVDESGGGGSGTGEPPDSDASSFFDDLREQCDALGAGPHPGDAPLRRLTRTEYNATVAHLLDDTTRPADAFPPEARALGFFGVADGQTVSTVLAEGYQQAAKDLAAAATADLPGLLGCDPADVACVEDFVRTFGSAAYRRPLADDELARLVPVFEWGRDNQTVRDGVEMVLEVLLQSPDFLYRPEFGEGEPESGSVRLSDYEMASRLSYLFIGSMPDEELLRAADAGELSTATDVLAHARRLIDSGAARASFHTFHRQWLDLESVSHIERDAAVYPGYDEHVPELFVEETLAFVDHVLFTDDASLETLLTAPYTMANAELAAFYGLSGPTGPDFEKVTTPDRGGLLTQGSLLAHHAQPLQTSPVHRGKFVREALLCQFPPPPPDDLIIVPPELDPGLTTRERFNEHSSNPGCSQCHQLMDPIGLGFEHFDSVGRYRETENELPIDATGELFATDVDGEFDGAIELGRLLAQSEQVASCMTRQWVRYAHGRSESSEDACTLVQLGDSFAATGHDIVELTLALTQTDAFLYRKEVTP